MKIFGREPALWLALVGAVVSALSTFVFHLTADQVGSIDAVAALVLGLITAWMTRDGLSAAILGLAHAVVALGLSFGMHFTPGEQTVFFTLVSAVIGMFVRTQATAPVSASEV
jgi:hypothetical protein